MNSIERNLLIFVKAIFHVAIIAVAVLNIVCVALKPAETNVAMVLAYILDGSLIVANLFPFCAISAIPNVAWLGITLFPILLSKDTYSKWIYRGLVDNDVIISYFNFGNRNDILFYLSVACWLVVFVAFIATLMINLLLNLDEDAKKSQQSQEEESGCRDNNDNTNADKKNYIADLKNLIIDLKNKYTSLKKNCFAYLKNFIADLKNAFPINKKPEIVSIV